MYVYILKKIIGYLHVQKSCHVLSWTMGQMCHREFVATTGYEPLGSGSPHSCVYFLI